MNSWKPHALLMTLAFLAAFGLGPAPGEAKAEQIPEPVRKVARDLGSGPEPGAVRASPAAGFYEVRADGEIFYVSADGRLLFHGNLYDIAKRRNLTEDTRREVRRELVRGMDEDSLIVFAPAGVKHRVTVFTDVDCPYCAKFHLEVPELNALGVEVRYAAWPRTAPGTVSYARSVSVWCARDRHQAMTDAKAGRAIADAECDNPVQAHHELGRRLGVGGTPTLFTDDGTLIGGYVPYRELVRRLEEAG